MEQVINSKKFNIEEEEKKSSKFISFFKESYYKMYKAFSNNKMLGHIRSTIALLLPILLLGYICTAIGEAIPSVKEDMGYVSYGTIGLYTLYFTIVLTYKNMKDKITVFPIMLVILVTNVICVSMLSNFGYNEDDTQYVYS